MNNEFIWQEDINYCGIVVRLAIVKFNDSNRFGACVSQIFEDEFVMVAAEVYNNVEGAKNFLLNNAIDINLEKLCELRSDLTYASLN